jgi:para-aminobenzoate synthetase component 1
MSRAEYVEKVGLVRAGIAAGDHYQVNLCRVLSAPLPPGADLVGLAGLLAQGNPSPYAGVVRLPGHDVDVVSASPELFLRRSGDQVESGPIKGTAPTARAHRQGPGRERDDRRPGAQRPRRGGR